MNFVEALGLFLIGVMVLVAGCVTAKALWEIHRREDEE